ncbi:MAG: transcriptional repressor [Spirochaetota bacterium]|nr:transcriptional repressor [Spirochaetota bacterium]
MDRYVEKARKVFRDFISQKSLKMTSEREKILDAVFSTHDHFDVDELLIRLKETKIKVSRATIYRTLDLLVECQIVKKMLFNDSQSRYEHVLGHEHHDHLICTECRKIIEFYSEEIEGLQKAICKKYDFQETDHSLKIYGKCFNCRNE